MPQSQTNLQQHEEETKNTHMTARTQSKAADSLFPTQWEQQQTMNQQQQNHHLRADSSRAPSYMVLPFTSSTPFKTYANRAAPDQAALVRASWSGSTLFSYGNMIRYHPTLVDLSNNFFVLRLCTKVKVLFIYLTAKETHIIQYPFNTRKSY